MSDTASTRRFLRGAAVNQKTGLANSTKYYLIAQGRFPRPVKIGPKMSAWDEAEIDAWMNERIAERDQAVT